MRSGAIEAGGTKFVCGRERMSGGEIEVSILFPVPDGASGTDPGAGYGLFHR